MDVRGIRYIHTALVITCAELKLLDLMLMYKRSLYFETKWYLVSVFVDQCYQCFVYTCYIHTAHVVFSVRDAVYRASVLPPTFMLLLLCSV